MALSYKRHRIIYVMFYVLCTRIHTWPTEAFHTVGIRSSIERRSRQDALRRGQIAVSVTSYSSNVHAGVRARRLIDRLHQTHVTQQFRRIYLLAIIAGGTCWT